MVAPAPAPAVASVPRRCVALGPAGCIAPGCAQDLRVAGNRALLADSGTGWVRLWADWPSLMPAPGAFDPDRVAALDDQLAVARADGLRTILTLYRTPAWVGSGVAAAPPWERFVAWAVTRYGARLDVLELCNEPNLQWWPQQGPSATRKPYGRGQIVVDDAIVRVFVTAKQIVADVGSEIVLAGPGSADLTASNRLRTGYHSLAERILTGLAAAGVVPGPRFAWTHHNYADVTYDQGPGSTAPDAATNPARQTNLAADMRNRLVGRWAGWPAGDADQPQLLLTEGGATLANMRARYGLTNPADQRRKQAELLQRNWDRMASDSGDGAGIAMTAQYLLYSDVTFDSGLCEPFDAGGAVRPSYRTWKGLPSFR
jgi:hypothetical protein